MKKVYAALLTLVALAVVTAGSALADTWGEPINTPDRFIVLPSFNNEAVRDTETGLVWEQSPSTEKRIWVDAQIHCNGIQTGNRMGWRAPTVQELSSLADPTVHGIGDVSLPAGHPFNVPAFSSPMPGYWSATTGANGTRIAWQVIFYLGGFPFTVDRITENLVWCVRGGHGVDPQ